MPLDKITRRGVCIDFTEQSTYLFLLATSRCLPSVDYSDDGVAESDHQKKIIAHLIAQGFEVTKVVIATKSAGGDIIACSPTGRFWRIEVKRTNKEVTPAQLEKLRDVWARSGLVMCASGYHDYLAKFDILTGELYYPTTLDLEDLEGPSL